MFLESNGNKGKKQGWIELICGCMFSGKTEELIRRLKRAEFARQKVRIFKPIVDNRYSCEEVVSHDKNSIMSTPVENSQDLFRLAQDFEVVGIDEAQFFDMDLPDVCNRLAANGTRIIIAGLDLDYLGRPFGPMPNLLATAEYVTKVHAICAKTGNLAHHSFRVAAGDNVVLLGEKESYVPLSREAFNDAMDRKQNNPDDPIDPEILDFVIGIEEQRDSSLKLRKELLDATKTNRLGRASTKPA